jgi:uncharacterized protein YlxP (DUF503 family)
MSSVVVLAWELRIPGCRSLKEKRSVVRSLRDRLRSRFHISAAETGFQDVHDRAEITVAFVTSDGTLAVSMADRIDTFVSETGGAVAILTRRETL